MEVAIEPTAAPVIEWQGPNPYYLGIGTDDAGVVIDLDESGWATTYSEWLRRPSLWALMEKASQQPVLTLVVRDGEQPYYTARHVGMVGSNGSNEVICYGIGKKRVDGVVERLWVMPNGVVCGGDDVDDIAIRFVRALGPR